MGTRQFLVKGWSFFHAGYEFTSFTIDDGDSLRGEPLDQNSFPIYFKKHQATISKIIDHFCPPNGYEAETLITLYEVEKKNHEMQIFSLKGVLVLMSELNPHYLICRFDSNRKLLLTVTKIKSSPLLPTLPESKSR